MKKLSTFIVMLLTFVVACGPSIEGEQKAWDANVNSVDKLKNEYPAYAQLIDYKLTEAQKIWDASLAIGDEEKKAEKMQEANNFFEKGSISVLRNLKSNIDRLKREKDNLLKTTAPDYSFTSKINNAVTEANSAVDAAENSLYVKGNLTKEDADVQLSRVGTKLSDATRTLKSVAESITKYKQEQEAKLKQEQTKTETQTTVAKEEAKPIKCEYCSTSSPAGSTKCKSCGAALPSK